MSKIVTLPQAIERVQKNRQDGKKIVFTNGCFDLLHAGHVLYLEEARGLGDMLIIGLNTDASVQKNKGPLRPIVPEKERGIVLAGLSCVDMIVYFDDPTPVGLIECLQPDIHVKGGDYEKTSLPEYSTIIAYGGIVEILPFYPGFSTSNLIEKVLKSYSGARLSGNLTLNQSLSHDKIKRTGELYILLRSGNDADRFSQSHHQRAVISRLSQTRLTSGLMRVHNV